jgi:hypothetical protein
MAEHYQFGAATLTKSLMPPLCKPLSPSPMAEASKEPKKVAKRGLPPDGSVQLVNNRDISTDVCATIQQHSCSRKNFGV